MNIRCNVALVLISLLFLTGCELTGEISGVITFEGAGLSGVHLEALLKDTTKSKTGTTGINGNYVISDLDPGDYVLTPLKAGYTFSPESYAITITEITAENRDDPGIDTINNITGQDFTATMLAQDTSNNDTLYSYDEDLTIFGEEPSIYSFTYNEAEQIASVGRDVGQNGVIDSIDYYSYDEYGLLDMIERDSDNNRSVNDGFDFTRDLDVDTSKSALIDAEDALELEKPALAGKEADVQAQTTVVDLATSDAEVADIALNTALVERDAARDLESTAVAEQTAAKGVLDAAAVAKSLAGAPASATVAYNEALVTYTNTSAAATTATNARIAAETSYTAAKAAADNANASVTTATTELASLQDALVASQAVFDEKSSAVATAQDSFDTLLSDNMNTSLDKAENGTRNNLLSGAVVNMSEYEYDLITNDLLSEKIDVDGDGNYDSTTFYNYDGLGNLVSVEFNDDNDDIMDAIINYTYDAVYNVVAISRDDNHDGVVESIYYFTYDVNNNIFQVDRDDGADGALDASNIYSYDASGFLIQIEQDATYPLHISNSIGFFNIELY